MDYILTDSTAMAGSDYTVTNGTLTFPAGSVSGATQSFTVAIADDNVLEGTEFFKATLKNITGGLVSIVDSVATARINDNDNASTAIGNITVNEDQTATFTITLSGSVQNSFSVNYATADSTAKAGADYTATSGTLTFAAGSTSGATQTFIVAISDDNIVEGNEDFKATLSGITGGLVTISDNEGTATITDTDVASIGIADITVNEDQTATFTITLSGNVQNSFSVSYATADSTAKAGSDYTAINGTLTFPTNSVNGTAQTFVVTINNDNVVEGIEHFKAELDNITGGLVTITNASATGTITDNDNASISIADVTVNENQTATFTVALTGNVQDGFSVNYATSNGTALAGSDYSAAIGTLTFATGSASGTTQTFTVAIANDGQVEGTENFIAVLRDITGGLVTISVDTAIVTIIDIDAASIAISDVTVNKNDGTATLDVTLSGNIQSAFTAYYLTHNIAALSGTDYTVKTGSITFPAGSLTGTKIQIPVTIINDTQPEATETFKVTLDSTSTNLIVIGKKDGVITILDSDVIINDDSQTTNEDQDIVIAVLSNDVYASDDVVMISNITQPANGSVTINADKTLTYNPSANFNGTNTFTYTVEVKNPDGTSTTHSANVTVTVSAVNDLPVVADINKTTDEDNTLNFATEDFNTAFNDIDAGDALARIRILTLPSSGTVKLNGTEVSVNQEMAAADLANISYVPAANYNGQVSLDWNGFDGTAYAATPAKVNITVNAVNDTPVITDVTKSVDEDDVLAFAGADFSSKFTDVDENDELIKIKVANLPANGTLKLSGVNITINQEIAVADLAKITFAPDADFNGSTGFRWNAFDGTVYSTSARVNITVNSVNDAPVVSDITKTVDEDKTLGFLAADFTSKFTDIDTGDNLTKVKITALPVNGTLKLSDINININQEIPAAQLSKITLVPNQNYNGSLSFEWNGSDGTAYATAPASVNITVNPLNDAPIISDVTKTVNEDSNLSFTAADFTSKFTDIDAGDELVKIKVITLPTNGTLKLNSVNITAEQIIGTVNLSKITFVPDADYNGSTNFEWNGYDADTYATIPAKVIITVTAQNDAPVISDITKTVNEDNTLTFTAADFTSRFTDIDADNILTRILVFTLPANGKLKVNGVNIVVSQEINLSDLAKLTFVPNADYNGSTSFEWNGYDGTAYALATAKVNITVAAINDAPIAVNDAITTNEDTPVTFNITNNDTDVDGTIDVSSIDLDPVSTGRQTIYIINGQGKFTVNDEGSVTFTPAANYNSSGTSISYTVKDDNGATSNVGKITIIITPVSDALVAVDDEATTAEDTPVTIAILDNDSDIDGSVNKETIDLDPLTAGEQKTFALPNQGVFKVNNNGTVTFSPYLHYNGKTTAINYTIKDNAGMTSNHASIVVTVTPVNDTPVAVNDNYTTKQGTAFNGDLLANDTDVEGDRLTATITAQPTNGKLVLYANGTFTYTPKPSFSGSDNFTYYVCDSGLPKACSNTATATISVGPVPIIGLAKSVSAPKLELNGSYSLTYTVTVENFGNIPLEDINITDDLTKAFSVPTQFSVNGGIRTTGNLVADVAFDGRTNTMLLSSGSLPVGGVEIITYMVNVLPNLNFGTFYSNVVGTATCSTRDVTTDKSTNGLDADPGNDKNPEESELTP